MLTPAYTEDLVEAGLDEAGRGCLAGPVVAAAVILPKDYTHKLLNDSKQLSAKKREELRIEIEKEALCFAVSEVSNQTIDELNILQASFLAMHQAIDNLTLTPELLLIDGNRFKNYPFIPHICIIKGDGKFMSIAAASVLAKTYRDDLMTTLAKDFPEYGWDKNFAYPTSFHQKAIKNQGLTSYHRLTFKYKSLP
jgi:ribonuclease HII